MKTSLLAGALAATLFAASAQAGTITPVNLDPPNQGLNDTTPRAPEGGNPGKTVGEQRRIVYQFAADLWGSVLNSKVETRVGASFQPLACTATGATLGSAGPFWIWNSPDFPIPGAWYHQALANSLAGVNLMAGDPAYVAPNDIEINSRFNANLGGSNPDGTPCLTGSGWYYGLDGVTPPGKISFLDVVMHEIGHGLGFSGFVGYSSGVLGERVGTPGVNDVYTFSAFDNVKNLRFTDAGMANADRAAAMRTPGRTSWDGAGVKASVPSVLTTPLILLQATGTLNANYQFYGTASFGPAATSANFGGEVALANDGVGDTADACEALPAGSLSGKVAFVNRGTCGFEFKTVNAQNAGATAVIIGNVASSGSPATAPGMADDPTLSAGIPALSLNLADANAFRTALPGISVVLGTVPGRVAGADAGGRALLYTPATVAGGSTFSHFDTSLTPNALMEPAINDSLAANALVDLTVDLFADEGWRIDARNARISGCDTGVKLYTSGGLIAGANVQAWNQLCHTNTNGKNGYQSCMSAYAASAQAAGLLLDNQADQVMACVTKAKLPK